MKTSTKTWLIVVALALLACIAVLRSRPDEPTVQSAPDASRGPRFEVVVVKPRIARPLFGILPNEIEEKIEAGGERRFDNASPGAKIGDAQRDHIELGGDDWELLIQTDGEGRIAPATHLLYTLKLAERQRKLRCRPADQPSGYLHTNARSGSDDLDGQFLVELAACEDAETGKTIKWPPAPLTVRGSFEGLPQGRR